MTNILDLSVHWSSNQLVWDVHHWLNWKKENVLNLPTNQFLCATSPHKNSLSLSNFPAFVKRHREARKARKIREKKQKEILFFILCFTKLTLNDQGDPLADRGRDLVARDAEVCSHLFSGDVLSW